MEQHEAPTTAGRQQINVTGTLTVSLAVWRVLTALVAAAALAVGLTAEFANGRTVLSLVLIGVFAWMATRRFAHA